jgi:hypothetical protein
MKKMEYVLGKNYIDKAGKNQPKDRQRIVDRAKIAYEAVLDSPEFRSEIQTLAPEE